MQWEEAARLAGAGSAIGVFYKIHFPNIYQDLGVLEHTYEPIQDLLQC